MSIASQPQIPHQGRQGPLATTVEATVSYVNHNHGGYIFFLRLIALVSL